MHLGALISRVRLEVSLILLKFSVDSVTQLQTSDGPKTAPNGRSLALMGVGNLAQPPLYKLGFSVKKDAVPAAMGAY